MATYAKAIVGAAVAALSTLATQLDDNALSAQEIVLTVVAFLVAFGAVWAVPNKTT